MAVGLQDAVNFLYNGILIGHQVQHTVTYYYIGHVGGHRHVLDIALPEFYIM